LGSGALEAVASLRRSCLSLILSDATQPSDFLLQLLNLTTQLSKASTPPAGQRTISPGLRERAQAVPAAWDM